MPVTAPWIKRRKQDPVAIQWTSFTAPNFFFRSFDLSNRRIWPRASSHWKSLIENPQTSCWLLDLLLCEGFSATVSSNGLRCTNQNFLVTSFKKQPNKLFEIIARIKTKCIKVVYYKTYGILIVCQKFFTKRSTHWGYFENISNRNRRIDASIWV